MPRDVKRPAPSASKRRMPPRMLARLGALGEREKLQVCCFMSSLVNGEPVVAIIEQARRPVLACPRCGGSAFNRCGHANGLQRFRCKSCARSFNCLTGTPLARLRLKNRWLAYCERLRDPASTVHSAASAIGVHPSTSFRWRHRFLDWTRLDRPRRLHGVAELGATALAESHKGARGLARPGRRRGGLSLGRRRGAVGRLAQLVEAIFARDRAGGTVDLVASSARPPLAVLHQHLLPKLARDVLLTAEAGKVYQEFARQAGLTFEPVDARPAEAAQSVLHTRSVTAYIDRFKVWLAHFNGVATRYLANYLGWQWAIDGNRIGDRTRFLRAALGRFTT